MPSPPLLSSTEQLVVTPSEKAFTTLRDASVKELAEMRSLFEATLQKTPAAFHPIDVRRVRTDDWQLLRFLQRTSCAADAFTQLKDALLWKQSVGMYEKRDQDYPREFYELNGIEVLGRNPQGQMVLWICTKYRRDFYEFKPYMKDFMIHEMEYMDQLAGPSGLQIISDAKHTGLFSVDIELTRFMQDTVSKYYPGCIRQTLIINLSMLLDPIFKLVLAFLNAELRATVKVVSRKKLIDFVVPQFIPEIYGGTRKTARVIRLPTGTPSFTEVPNIKMTDEQKTRYKELLASMGVGVGQ